jgi:alcohol dehydrogenase (cytochrome c)
VPSRFAAAFLLAGAVGAADEARAQSLEGGRKTFEQRCAICHGAGGGGGERGPAIERRLSALADPELIKLVHEGRPLKGMPGSPLPPPEMAGLLKFLRALQEEAPPVVRRTVRTTDGRTLEGQVLGEGFEDLQLLTDDKRIHLLRRAGESFREVTSQTEWPTYNGDPRGNRYTAVTQIDKTTVPRLAPRWMFSIPDAGLLQVTPVVVGGIMYVTARNQCFALDAGSGRPLWHYEQPPTRGVQGGNANRGVAVRGDRVFMVTDHAHLVALSRFTGERLWDTEMADWRQNYAASSAPLVAGDVVISGVSGGEHGANGFVAAHDAETGKEVWRFWSVPRPGEPGSETWQGKDIAHGGAPTWFTGSYDPDLDLVYWPTGNPTKEYNGDDRKGDNLFANSIVALDRKTGRRVWHYQFTPHDLWDWDATQTSVLVDAEWQGRPRKLMLHADRNGFFYVLDRADGTLLLARPFVRNLTWATGIGPDGRPLKVAGQEPSAAGTKVCPSQDGATNWFSPSYDPATGLYYVQTYEKCSVYTKSDQGEWESGRTYLGGTQRTARDPRPERILRAIDVRTGRIAWELPQPGPADSWGGTLATAAGLVIVAADGGSLMAVDSASGAPLWTFQTNQTWKASPMTYVFDGTQHVAIAAGPNIIALAVADAPAPARAETRAAQPQQRE